MADKKRKSLLAAQDKTPKTNWSASVLSTTADALLALAWHMQGGEEASEPADKGHVLDQLVAFYKSQDADFAAFATPERVEELRRKEDKDALKVKAPARLEAVAAAGGAR
jgi:hypothetical protein